MPITYSIDAPRRLVRTTVTGPVLEDDPDAYVSRLLGDPAYQPGMRVLVTCTKIELGSVSASIVRRFARTTRGAEHRIRGVVVAIVAEQSAVYGMARMYQLLRDPPYALRVFRDTEEAQRWLEQQREATTSD